MLRSLKVDACWRRAISSNFGWRHVPGDGGIAGDGVWGAGVPGAEEDLLTSAIGEGVAVRVSIAGDVVVGMKNKGFLLGKAVRSRLG